jgi:vancomycin permeability regulator SanA
MHKYMIATVVLLSMVAPAMAAEFYIVWDQKKEKCDVTDSKPTDANLVLGTYASKDEGKAAKDNMERCQPKTDAQ